MECLWSIGPCPFLAMLWLPSCLSSRARLGLEEYECPDPECSRVFDDKNKLKQNSLSCQGGAPSWFLWQEIPPIAGVEGHIESGWWRTMGTVICCLGVTTAADKSGKSSSACWPVHSGRSSLTAYSLKIQCGVEKRVYATIVFLILA